MFPTIFGTGTNIYSDFACFPPAGRVVPLGRSFVKPDLNCHSQDWVTSAVLTPPRKAHVYNTVPPVRSEILNAMTMKNSVFCDVTSCCSCENRRFGGTHCLQDQGGKNQRSRNNVSSNLQLIQAAMNNWLPMMEAIRSSETSVLI
jgi:hypothetical protein